MNPPPETALDGEMWIVLSVGAALFLAGLVLCLRRTRFGNQMLGPVFWTRRWRGWFRFLSEMEPGRRGRFDGSRMIGIALLAIGYVLVGVVLLFVAPGWGALAFAVGFAAVVAIALARSR